VRHLGPSLKDDPVGISIEGEAAGGDDIVIGTPNIVVNDQGSPMIATFKSIDWLDVARNRWEVCLMVEDGGCFD
jgi:hypothetical protein